MLALALALALAPQDVVVGSKSFTESRILGEMIALVIQAETGLDVAHESGLGGTQVCFGALRAGEIDVYAEYTGTAWSVVLGIEEKVRDPLRAYLVVKERFRELYDVEWLDPFGLNNTYAIAMREDRARELGVRAISGLAPHAAELTAGFSIEFTNRPDGWPGLARFYGLEGMRASALEHGLAYEAVERGSIDVVDAYSTDAKLLRYDLRVLEDDLGFFPPYDAAPLVRGALLRERPEVGAALRRLAFRLSDARMTALNHAVEVEGAGFRETARAFLVEEGLFSAGAEVEDDASARARTGLLAFLLTRRGETLRLLLEHLRLVVLAVGAAAAVAVPLGVAITRSAWAERISLGLAGAIQTIPALALLAFLIAAPGLGLSARTAVIALALYAVLPILRNTFAGVRGVDPELVDVARGIGLTERQILFHVELPLAVGTIMAGVRTATVITVGFATLAAFIGAGGLGEPIVTGLYLDDRRLILSGALPAALLALAADHGLGALERRLTPRGLRRT